MRDDLVAEFLLRVEGWTGKEVSRSVRGVTETDVSRWRRGVYDRISEPKRAAIRAFLDRTEAPPESDPFADGVRFAAGRMVGVVRDLLGGPGGAAAPRDAAMLRKLDEALAELSAPADGRSKRRSRNR